MNVPGGMDSMPPGFGGFVITGATEILNYYVGNGLDHSAVGISVIVSACTAERPMPMHTYKIRAFGFSEGADLIML